ncbi:MAG: twin-arginine translocase TatA/TatE family subunit [Chloroflexi bacterium]|nr:twin-arginine translocase TatA/TatE family subunit [Chloroflexota bacterium]
MPNIRLPELIIILAIILIIFGAGKLPEIGGAIGRGIRSFRGGVSGEGAEGQVQNPDDRRDSKS